MKKINRKAFLSSMSILVMVIIIVLVSLFQAGLNPNFWMERDFQNDMIFITGIIIFGVVSGSAEGDNYYRTKEDGLFLYTYKEYENIRTKIDYIIDKFRQWADFLYRREYTIKVRNFLSEKGVEQYKDLLMLSHTQIKTLNEPRELEVNGVAKPFKSLTQEQIDAVLFVMAGKLKLKRVNDDYFLNAFAKGGRKSMYERASQQEKMKQRTFIALLIYRVILSLVVSGIFAGLAIQEGDGHDIANKFMDLVSRLFALITSIGWGFFVGNEMVKEDTIFLDYKRQTLHSFDLEVGINKTFIPLSAEEEAKIQIKKKEVEVAKDDTKKIVLD